MGFDEFWNSSALDSLRAKYPDMDGDEIRCVWNQAKAAPQSGETMRYDPPLSEKRIIATGASILEQQGFERMTATLVADDCWRSMLRQAVTDGLLTIPNTAS